jgi:hypothetical protein
VKGFGAKTVAKLRKYVVVSGETTLRSTRAEAAGPFSGPKPAAPSPAASPAR